MFTILLVDDNVLLLKALQRQLSVKDSAWEIATAVDGHEAIKLARSRNFDLVITDILMPEGDGFETIHQIRKRCPSTKFIAMSGASDPSGMPLLEVAKRLGADEVLAKPFTSEDVFGAIYRVLASTTPAPLPARSQSRVEESETRRTA